MPTPHKHAVALRAYADGAQIQYRDPKDRIGTWRDTSNPGFHACFEYRVKPEPKTPGQIAEEAYYKSCGFKSTWDVTKDGGLSHRAWEAAAKAVLDHERAETIKSVKGEA